MPLAQIITPEGLTFSSRILSQWQPWLRSKAQQSQPLSIKRVHTKATFCNTVSAAQGTRAALPNLTSAGLDNFHILKGPEPCWRTCLLLLGKLSSTQPWAQKAQGRAFLWSFITAWVDLILVTPERNGCVPDSIHDGPKCCSYLRSISNESLPSLSTHPGKDEELSLLQTSATQGRHLLGVSSGPWSGRQKNCWQHGIWLLQPSGWDWEREWVCGPDSWLMHVSTSELWGSGFTPLLASVLHSAPLWGTEGWHQSFQGQGVGSIHCSHRQIQPFPLQALQEEMS